MTVFYQNNSLLISNKNRRTIVEYKSDIPATGGSSGASDPTTYNWIYAGNATGYSDAYDSGDGGWRIVDGTALVPSTYYQNLSSNQAADIANKNWILEFTIALDKDAIQSNGTTVTDYYLAPNNNRQNSFGPVVRINGLYDYAIIFTLDSSNQIQIQNRYTTGEIYDTGYYLGGANPFPEFLTYALKYNKSTTQASVYINDTFLGNISKSTTSPTADIIFFGSPSSGGQGSAIWHSLSLKVF